MSFWSRIFGRRSKPVQPTYRAIGIYTEPNATVKLDAVGEGVTNYAGYYVWPKVSTLPGAEHIWVTAVGFGPYSMHIDLTPGPVNQDIFVGKPRWDGSKSTDINLPALVSLAPVRVKRTGIVLAESRSVRDNQGLFHPLGLSLFWAMQGWKNEREHFKRNAEWAAAKKFDYLRILTEVGWTGREIDPTSPQWSDWGTVLREVMDYCYNDLGLRLELTLIGKGTSTKPIWLAQEVSNIIGEERSHQVIDIECANEYTVHGGPSIDQMKLMARELRARTPNIIALSSPGDWDALKAATLDVGIKGFAVHSDRGSGDYKWRQVRQVYDFKNADPFVVFNNEPAGPGSSVSTNDSPLQLAMMRALGVIMGGAGFVLHTGTGVFGDGKGHPTAGPRPANFDEIANIDAIVAALRGIDVLLPDGVENWKVQISRNTSSGSRVSPFTPHNHWEGPSGDGVNKAYSSIASDGRWIQMPTGVRGHVVLTASYPLRDVVVYDPLSLQPREGVKTSYGQGETLDLPGGGTDAMVAYIIQGHRA